MRNDGIFLWSLKFTLSHMSTHCILHKFYNTVFTWKLLYNMLYIWYKSNNCRIYLSLYIYSFVLTRLQYHTQLENRYIISNQETIRHRSCNFRLLWIKTVTIVIHTSDPSSTLLRSSDTLRVIVDRTATQSVTWHTTVPGWCAAYPSTSRPSKSIRYPIRNKPNQNSKAFAVHNPTKLTGKARRTWPRFAHLFLDVDSDQKQHTKRNNEFNRHHFFFFQHRNKQLYKSWCSIVIFNTM